MEKQYTIGIIGGGFSGLLVAHHLIHETNTPLHIQLFDPKNKKGCGTAYSVDSDAYLLNVVASKMSAFAEYSEHFLNWVMHNADYRSLDRSMIAQAFLPRKLYGEYLSFIAEELISTAGKKNCTLEFIPSEVTQLSRTPFEYRLTTKENSYDVHSCVLATGNERPKTPTTISKTIEQSAYYFGNPWLNEIYNNSQHLHRLLIIGNGLTMVDTVMGLYQRGFKGTIYSISPNGFNILPHRNNGLLYSKLNEELPTKKGLREIASSTFKHIRIVRKFGLSAEPVIDSLRPHVQKIWQELTIQEKKLFLSRIRHLWGVARHRIPLHMHDKIQQLRIEKKLHIIAGRLHSAEPGEKGIDVVFTDKKTGRNESLSFDRIINCTGPNSDLHHTTSPLLKQLYKDGYIIQDELKLGLRVDLNTYQLINSEGAISPCFYTLGGHLRGELWESTAVNELRTQAKELALKILQHYTKN